MIAQAAGHYHELMPKDEARKRFACAPPRGRGVVEVGKEVRVCEVPALVGPAKLPQLRKEEVDDCLREPAPRPQTSHVEVLSGQG
jgi:hypothetical protein